MPPSVIRVLRLDMHTAERLGTAPPAAGRVHSVFAHALNVEWHDGRLLALQGPGPLRAPFAMALARLPEAAGMRPGAPVQARGDTIALDGALLVWTQARIADLRMPEAARPRERRALICRAFPSEDAGDSAPALRARTGRAAQSRLAAGLAGGDPAAFLDGALRLLGMGEGLTPAGDDCLVGALAAIHRFRAGWLRRHPEIGAGLRAAAWSATTDVAREFVLHAVAGRFADEVIDLLTAGSPEAARRAAERLLRLGATSGADTLAGIRLALRALGGPATPLPEAGAPEPETDS